MNYTLLALLLVAALALAMAVLALAPLAERLAKDYSERFQKRMTKGLNEAFVFSNAGALFRLHVVVALGFCGVTYLAFESLAVTLAMGGVVGLLPSALLLHFRKRRVSRFRRQTPDTLSLLAGGLKAGSSLPQVIGEAAHRLPAPAGQEFELIVRQLRMGQSFDMALRDLDRRIRTEETKLLVAALQIGALTGGNTADALEALASATRRKLDLEGKVAALTAQGRLQAWVMAILPLLLACALYVIDPVSMGKLFSTAMGWLVVGGVIVLQVLGGLMIRKIVAIEI